MKGNKYAEFNKITGTLKIKEAYSGEIISMVYAGLCESYEEAVFKAVHQYGIRENLVYAV